MVLSMKKFAAILLTTLSLVIAVVSLRYFLLPDTAPLLRLKSGVYRVALLVHAGAALVALALGPFQFSGSLRRRFVRGHRRLGYVYFGGVFLGGAAGLVSATGAEGGLSARTGFLLLGRIRPVNPYSRMGRRAVGLRDGIKPYGKLSRPPG